jgi:hypothetical protein
MAAKDFLKSPEPPARATRTKKAADKTTAPAKDPKGKAPKKTTNTKTPKKTAPAKPKADTGAKVIKKPGGAGAGKKIADKKTPAKEDATKDDHFEHGEGIGVSSPRTFWDGFGVYIDDDIGVNIDNDTSYSESHSEINQGLHCPSCDKAIELSFKCSQGPPNEVWLRATLKAVKSRQWSKRGHGLKTCGEVNHGEW